jgi:hypothetical protein
VRVNKRRTPGFDRNIGRRMLFSQSWLALGMEGLMT